MHPWVGSGSADRPAHKHRLHIRAAGERALANAFWGRRGRCHRNLDSGSA
jgi:hypothetical protein